MSTTNGMSNRAVASVHPEHCKRWRTRMYTDKNFKTKAQLKAAVQAWNQAQLIPQGAPAHYERPHAAAVTYHQPGPFGGNEPRDGTIYVEGPHYPAPHRWYAACIVKGGVIVKVK